MYPYGHFRKDKPRLENWRSFVEEGLNPEQRLRDWQQESLREMDFQTAFPDYDFNRKPRLGSM
jgi:hypothetical protein